jgi:hypothetical protein
MKTTNTLNLVSILALGGLISLVAGCASTPNAKEAKAGSVFPHPIAKVQKASVDALTVIGCEIKKQEPAYAEGYRPRKMGLFVGSGGETVGVWLAEKTPTQTEVKVTTAKTFAGRAGQKDWDKEVLAEITKTLGQ